MVHDNTVFKNSSWGRTRGPKALSGTNAQGVTDIGTAAAAKTAHEHATNNAGIYKTQNQRFLHLTTDASGVLANIWVYMHASGLWAEFKVGGASVTMGNSEYKVVEIDGVDLVAFNITTELFAAASTF
jgi:hypothetical protein